MTQSAGYHCLALGLVGILLVGAEAAHAEDHSVAIVEDTSGAVAGIEALDLLRPGREIDLRGDGGLILSYLDSCQRENIRGGKVRIGKVQSVVTGGVVARERLACDPAALSLSPEQANQSATLVFREPDKVTGDPVAETAAFMMDTRQPLLIAPGHATVAMSDLRHAGRKWSVKVVKGVADLTAGHGLLDQGGVYRIDAGSQKIVFRVGKDATDAPLKLLKRVIRLPD